MVTILCDFDTIGSKVHPIKYLLRLLIQRKGFLTKDKVQNIKKALEKEDNNSLIVLINDVLKGENALKVARLVEESLKVEDVLSTLGQKLISHAQKSEQVLLLLVSHAPDFFIDILQQQLGFDSMLCPSFKIVDGKFTEMNNFLEDPDFTARFVKELKSDSTSKVVAIGVTETDQNLLSAADIPIRYDLIEDEQAFWNLIDTLL